MTEFRQGNGCRTTGLALRHHDDARPGEIRFLAFPAILAWLLAVFIGGCGQSGSVREAGDGNEVPAEETGSADLVSDLPQPANPKHKNPDIEFTVLACNVENLFDIDGVALFDEYSKETYKPAHLLKKLQNVASLLATCGEKGPDIILFQEIEADQTPGTAPMDLAAILEKYEGQTIDKMLAEPVSEDVRDLPATAFLAKALSDTGLGPYEVKIGEYRQDPTGRVIAHINVTFSRFPVIKALTHHSPGARGTLEVVHEVNGYPLHTFNNHWKSGAGDAESEQIRIGNAQVVRTRLNELLEADPNADIVLGGDFNSAYNQALRYPQMQKTGLNAVLGSQGDELAIQQTGGPALYNLWHELPVDKRGSDVYQDEWGTLIQMLLVRGLYDKSGIQYIDNSFSVLAIDNINVQRGSGVPIRWNIVDGTGTGYSDHLPVSARFRTVPDDEPGKFLTLQNPGRQADITSAARKVDYSFVTKSSLSSIKEFGSDEAIRKLENLGRAYRVEAVVSGEKPFRIRVFDEEYNVWSYDVDLRREIYSRFPVGGPMEFIGEIGIHEGKWQFVVRDVSWLLTDPVE